MQIWRASTIPIQDLTDSQVSLETKMTIIFEWHKQSSNNQLQAQLPFWILRRIWKSRNKLIFGREANTWEKDLSSAHHDAEEWSTLGDTRRLREFNSPIANGSRRILHWRRPEAGWIKCNYDGSYIQHLQRTSAAWIIRNELGHHKGAGKIQGTQATSALEAECNSLISAMQHLWAKGHTKVIFEGDCKILVDVLQGKAKRFDITNWLHEIQTWKRRFSEVQFRWIPRQVNKSADTLAKYHNQNDQGYTFFYFVPRCILDSLHSEYISSI